jgi:NADPH2:quinone reductase
MSRDASIHGVALINASPAEVASLHAALGAGLANGSLRPVIGKELPLKEAPAAHQTILQPGAYAKIVLIP